MAKKPFLDVRQIKLRIGVLRPSVEVLRLAWRAAVSIRDEVRRSVLHRPRVPHHVEAQKSVVSHAEPHRSAFDEIFDPALTFVSTVGLFDVFNGGGGAGACAAGAGAGAAGGA